MMSGLCETVNVKGLFIMNPFKKGLGCFGGVGICWTMAP